MPRGRSRGRGRGRGFPALSASSPTPVLSNNTPSTNIANSSDPVICGTCSFPTGDDAIGCDRCDGWFHPGAMCLGLPEQSIADIIRLEGEGILFVCLQCRITDRSGAAGPGGGLERTGAFKQMSEMVFALCNTVKSLVTQMETLQHTMSTLVQSTSGSAPAPAFSNGDSFRTTVREEVREMRERERRQKSIIIRGLPNFTTDAVVSKFSDISRFLLDKDVQIVSVKVIDAGRGIFRGDVADPDRRLLLSRVSRLKNSEYRNVFVTRDLTYQQRQDLFRRRNNRVPGLPGNGVAGNSVVSDENAGHSSSGSSGPGQGTTIGGAAALTGPLSSALNDIASSQE